MFFHDLQNFKTNKYSYMFLLVFIHYIPGTHCIWSKQRYCNAIGLAHISLTSHFQFHVAPALNWKKKIFIFSPSVQQVNILKFLLSYSELSHFGPCSFKSFLKSMVKVKVYIFLNL